jgi:hypothetical protein
VRQIDRLDGKRRIRSLCVAVSANIENCAFGYNSEEKKLEYLTVNLYGSNIPQPQEQSQSQSSNNENNNANS